jgi:hypothetical protein
MNGPIKWFGWKGLGKISEKYHYSLFLTHFFLRAERFRFPIAQFPTEKLQGPGNLFVNGKK